MDRHHTERLTVACLADSHCNWQPDHVFLVPLMPMTSATFEAAEQAAGYRHFHHDGQADVERSVGDEDRDGAEDGCTRSVAVNGQVTMEEEAQYGGNDGGEPEAQDAAGGIVDDADALMHGAAEQ